MRFSVLVTASLVALAVVNPAQGGTASVGSAPHLVGFSSDAVLYTAAAGEANDVTMTQPTPGQVAIEDLGANVTAVPPCSSVDAHHATCPFGVDKLLDVDLGDGDDFLTLTEMFCDEAAFLGGDGDDRMRGDECFTELFFGGPGDDHLRGRGERDIIDGGAGSDTMSGGTSGFSHANAFNPHFDTLTYEDRVNGVRVRPDGLPNDGEPGEGDDVRGDFELVVGGAGNDLLVGHGNNLSGRAGNDTLIGSSVRESLRGGSDDDVLRGGPGPDRLFGNEGGDIMLGGPGRDRLTGGAGSDQLVGGIGQDRLFGLGGPDVLSARDGHFDFLAGGSGFDRARIDLLLDEIKDVEKLLP